MEGQKTDEKAVNWDIWGLFAVLGVRNGREKNPNLEAKLNTVAKLHWSCK